MPGTQFSQRPLTSCPSCRFTLEMTEIKIRGATVSDLEIRVLGPVEVLRGGRQVPLGGRTTLTLLAGLAVAPRRVVSVNTLIGYVWDADLPDNPRAALHNGVSRLRRILGEGTLETLGLGYRLRVGTD